MMLPLGSGKVRFQEYRLDSSSSFWYNNVNNNRVIWYCATVLRRIPFWSSEGGSFVMRSLNPCPENFSQNIVDYPNLLRGGGVIYYAKSEVLDPESNLLSPGGGGDNLPCEIRSA